MKQDEAVHETFPASDLAFLAIGGLGLIAVGWWLGGRGRAGARAGGVIQ